MTLQVVWPMRVERQLYSRFCDESYQRIIVLSHDELT